MNKSLSDEEQVEAERLRHLRADIEALLKEYDACGVVYLAGRFGRFESVTSIEASWSKLRFIDDGHGGGGLGLRSKLADYAGDVERQKRELEWSVGVVSGFAQMMGVSGLGWLEASMQFDRGTGAEHTPWKRDDPRD